MKLTYAGRIGTAALALVALAACSSPSQITTRDGQTVTTADRPEVNDDKDFITYERDGREVQVNKSDVKSIEEIK
ncbi:YgdI/YgdR family lipoprotein [Corticimicrobacter populi]|uniref:YgdI/YgdR family lipoprotein n=1 Tax=Corticimicrobacter populi TaxID=2175229 RepID=A0A2V1K2V0_9BURK|nr:YgdI/YgdR family lipoprotein [Corticimicrobacter populi]PWF24910.1 YgdI/YgdR family lipoprotein [Corticimicrobacter populi]